MPSHHYSIRLNGVAEKTRLIGIFEAHRSDICDCGPAAENCSHRRKVANFDAKVIIFILVAI